MPDDDSRLPAVHDPGAVEEMVFEGEVVDEAPPVRRFIPAPGPLPPRVRWLALQGRYVAAGAVVTFRRRRAERTLPQTMQRAAANSGNHEAALKWRQQQLDEEKEKREKWEGRVENVVKLVKVAPFLLGCAVAAPGVLGIFLAIAAKRLALVAAPYLWAAHAVALAVEVASVAWTVASIAVPLGIVARLHHLGRNAGREGPGWIATASDADDVVIDETTIAQALEALRIPQIRDYLSQGLPLQYIVPCRLDGRGTYFEIRLPKGVPAEKVVRRRADLASGLYRLPKEVWPSVGSEAAILRGWIADKGALEDGAGPYPLLERGMVDVFKGVPFGRTLRGEPVRMPVIGRNSICGGAPEQGKSNTARVVACGYTLDISAELRIYVPDANFDFDWFQPRCSRYLVGAEDEVIERMLEEQELLKEEIQSRGNLLRDYEEQEVTREIAHAGVGLHPVLVLVEEAHVPIGHKAHGKDFGRLLGENVRLCRKRGIHIMVSTQAPVRGAMPRDVTVNCTVGIAHALADLYANDAILGPGAHAAGHRATELIIDADKGIALCKGITGEARSEMVQVHRIQASRDSEQVTPIVKRALAEMARKGRELPGAGLPMIESRDLLTDLAEVTRDDSGRVNLADLPPRLRKIAPNWAEYKKLTGVELRQRLEVEGVRVYTTGGTLRVDPADLAGRATGPTDATLAGQDWVEPLDD